MGKGGQGKQCHYRKIKRKYKKIAKVSLSGRIMDIYLLLLCAFSYFPSFYNKHVNKKILERSGERSKELEKSN